MGEVDRLLFAHWNLSPLDPAWAVTLARFASAWLPSLAIGCLAAALLFGTRRWRLASLQVVLAMVVVWVLVLTINRQWPQPRPFMLGIGQLWIEHGPTSGFPSRHAAVGLAFGWSALRVSPTRLVGLLCLGAALLIAWSRVALGVHFPADVLAGSVVAVLVAEVVSTLATAASKC
ncbi:phosphatase PAP2 family protein [Hydrogenophaga sp. XSHU_21]